MIFAAPSILLIFGGVNLGWGAWAIWVGAGIAAYGAIYFGFHDVIVHKRIAHRYVARSAYMKRIVQAHRLHHAVETKEGTVSFGFLWAPPAEELKAELARREPGRRAGPGERRSSRRCPRGPAAGPQTVAVRRCRVIGALRQRLEHEDELGRLVDDRPAVPGACRRAPPPCARSRRRCSPPPAPPSAPGRAGAAAPTRADAS